MGDEPVSVDVVFLQKFMAAVIACGPATSGGGRPMRRVGISPHIALAVDADGKATWYGPTIETCVDIFGQKRDTTGLRNGDSVRSGPEILLIYVDYVSSGAL